MLAEHSVEAYLLRQSTEKLQLLLQMLCASPSPSPYETQIMDQVKEILAQRKPPS